jgi:serine/threonine-protein kinase
MVVQLTPDNADAFAALGGIYHFMGRFDDAEAALKKSISIKPNAAAYSNLGTTYYFQRRYGDAVTMMEKALELGASGYLFWGNLAEAYRQTGRKQQAAEAFRLAAQLAEDRLAVNPKDSLARARMAQYWAKLGNREKALAEIEQALGTAPKQVNVLFRAAIVYELTGNRDRALKALNAAIEGGYSIEEIRAAADLEELHKDPRYRRMMEGRASR